MFHITTELPEVYARMKMLKYTIYMALFQIFYLLIKNYHETNHAIAFQSYP